MSARRSTHLLDTWLWGHARWIAAIDGVQFSCQRRSRRHGRPGRRVLFYRSRVPKAGALNVEGQVPFWEARPSMSFVLET